MKAKKLFYIIEPIDVDNDKIPDGFLASQYRIDKYGNKIFTKNKYITFTDLKSRINIKKGGISFKPTINNNENKEVVQITKEQFNQYMNQQLKPGQLPPAILINNGDPNYHPNYPHNYHPNYHPNYPHNYHHNYGPPNYPPNYHPNENNNGNNKGSFGDTIMNNVGYGVGAGVGLAAGDALFDGIASMF